MANPKLSLEQFAILALGQLSSPWHFGKLPEVCERYSVSLKKSLSALSSATAVVYARLGDYQQFLQAFIGGIVGLPAPVGVKYSSAVNIWTAGLHDVFLPGGGGGLDHGPVLYPTQKDILVKLWNILSPMGCSIVYLSDDWTIVGIAGTYGALANAQVAIVPSAPPNSFWDATPPADDLTKGSTGAVMLAPLPGQSGGTVVLSGEPYAPLAPAKVGNIPLGLLWIYLNNTQNNTAAVEDITAIQLLAQHLQINRDTMVNLLVHTIPVSSEGIAGAKQDLNGYMAWLNYLQTITTVNTGGLPSGALSLGFDGDFTIPKITLQPADTSQLPISISEWTVQPDGSSTGGTVS